MSDCPNATPTMPRPECPTPQFDRGEAARLLLNGTWAFHTDRDGTGEVRGLPTAPDAAFGETIIVPFCREILERDINHPAIVGWCPLNETPDEQDQDLVRALATVTRQYDPTRVFIGTSGWTHVPGVSDMVDRHDYEQDPARFAENLDKAAAAGITFLSEYGGTLWAPTDDAAWGYGQAPLTEEEYLARLDGLTAAILAHPRMSGLCYTQLTDVEQEVNGLYTYDRRPKFDPARIRAIFGRPAAVETSTKR